MSIKVDSYTSTFDADIEELQQATLVYPTTEPTGGSSVTSADYAYQMPPHSGVVLSDGRVLHCQSIGYNSGTGRHARFVVLAYADSEEDYCTVNNSVDMSDWRLLFDAGSNKAHVVASLSRLDSDTLALIVTTDRYNLHCGDGADGPVWSYWMEAVSGQLYGVGNRLHSRRTDRLWEINKATGRHTTADRHYDSVTLDGANRGNVVGDCGGLAYDSAGADMYFVDSFAHNLHTIDMTTTYRSAAIGGTGVTNERAMAYDPDGDVLYGLTNTGVANTDSLYTVNRATGAWTLVGLTGIQYCADMTYDNTNNIMYGLAPGGLYTINLGTGAWTLVGSTGNDDPQGLVWDSTDDTLYMTGAPDNPGPDTEWGTPDPSVGWGTVNQSTGAYTEIGTIVWEYEDMVEPNFPNQMGTYVWYSMDDGVTWQNENMAAFRSWEEVDEYVTENGTLLWDPTQLPNYLYVTTPTDTSNVWGRTDQQCSGNNGIVYQTQDGRYYATAAWVVRDDTFTTSYNVAQPCLIELTPRATDGVYHSVVWPTFNTGSIPPNSNYGEGTAPDYDFTHADVPIVWGLYDWGSGSRHSTRSHWSSRNLIELPNGALIWTTTNINASRESDSRIWMYTNGATWWSGITYIDSAPRAITPLRMADGNQDGNHVWIASGGSGGGLYTGVHRTLPVSDLSDLTQLVAGTGYNIRIQGSAHTGCRYHWVTWAKNDSSAAIGLRAWTRVPCSVTLPPFEFPHTWHDILKKWDAGDKRGAELLLNENLRAVEEVVFWNAMCGVPEFPHPWGEMVVGALKGNKLWRDCLEDQDRYLAEFLTGTARSAKTPFVFTARWSDALTQWGQDHLMEATIDHMWSNFVSWQKIASTPPEDGLCEGEDAGIWRL